MHDACVASQCAGGYPLSCNDGDLCTTDSCDPFAGCEFEPIASCEPAPVPALRPGVHAILAAWLAIVTVLVGSYTTRSRRR